MAVLRILGVIGKLLISMGTGVLLFVAWSLWGTGLYTQRQQGALAREFTSLPSLEASVEKGTGGLTYRGPPKSFKPGPGAPVFRLRIPAIRLNQLVVQGVGVEQLKAGPGHYPACGDGFTRPLCTELDQVWPGERGRTIISGHRTTYGAPFGPINELKRGDKIIMNTKWGRFSYEVTHKEIVPPDSRDIANPVASESAEVALTTCNPRYSAAQRLIVFGELRA